MQGAGRCKVSLIYLQIKAADVLVKACCDEHLPQNLYTTHCTRVAGDVMFSLPSLVEEEEKEEGEEGEKKRRGGEEGEERREEERRERGEEGGRRGGEKKRRR